jgi:hypothetical protein
VSAEIVPGSGLVIWHILHKKILVQKRAIFGGVLIAGGERGYEDVE